MDAIRAPAHRFGASTAALHPIPLASLDTALGLSAPAAAYIESRIRRWQSRSHSPHMHAPCDNDPMRPPVYAPRPAHLKWLLDSDPAIRWQAMRDLTDASPAAIAAERSRVATEGWGAQLLARQSIAGHWGGGAHWDLIA